MKIIRGAEESREENRRVDLESLTRETLGHRLDNDSVSIAETKDAIRLTFVIQKNEFYRERKSRI